MYTDILGYKVFNKTKDEFLDEVSKKDKVNESDASTNSLVYRCGRINTIAMSLFQR